MLTIQNTGDTLTTCKGKGAVKKFVASFFLINNRERQSPVPVEKIYIVWECGAMALVEKGRIVSTFLYVRRRSYDRRDFECCKR